MEDTESGREHERLPINVIAEITCDSADLCKYKVTDLSKTGAYLIKSDDSGPSPEVGTRVHMKLVWPIDTGTPPLEVDADIMRVGDDGIGVQFIY